LAARAPTRDDPTSHHPRGDSALAYDRRVPSFDIVSEVDAQELRNAVDQANREATTRFDFKDTKSVVDLSEKEIVLHSATEDRLHALYQVLEEKMVKRSISLKVLEPGKIEEAARSAARQHIALKAGISADVGRQINRLVKDLGLKNVSSSTQGDQVRVTSKSRDDLQKVMAACREADIPVPLQFTNFRD
jgi:cyclic-di-GMP-binding protein